MDSTEKKKINNFNNTYSEASDTRSYNVGTSDYSKHEIQPWSIWKEYHLNPWDADIVKRVLRNKEVEGMTPEESRILDYEKIIHICKERINQIKEGYKFLTMIDNNSNFPPNVDPLDKSAPWNQEKKNEEPKRVKVCCVQGLSRTYEIEDCENLFYSFKNDNKVYNIPKLLQELQSLVEVRIKELKSALPSKDPMVNKLKKGILEHYEDVLEASKGWILDDEDICRE